MASREYLFPPIAILLLLCLPRASVRGREWLAAIIPLLAAVSIAVDQIVYTTDGRGSLWLVAVALWGNLMLRPRFPMACAVSLGVTLCAIAVAASQWPAELGTWNAAAVVIGAAVLSLLTKHRMEKDNRVGFAYRLLNAIRVKQLEQANEQLLSLAHHDALTGLPNRVPFFETYPRLIRNAVRAGKPISILFVDADEFKRLNDTLGHAKGDEALVLIGQVLREIVRRPLDLVTRYGGEEFVVLLPETARDEALGIAERIRKGVMERGFPNPQSQHGCLTVSIGVCGGVPEAESLGELMMALADQALYRAKHTGRNKVSWQGLDDDDAETGAMHL